MTKKLVNTQEEVVSNSNSRQILDGYYSQNYVPGTSRELILIPDFNPLVAMQVIKNDPVVKGIIKKFADKCLESGWKITAQDKRSRKRTAENKLKELRFDKLLRRILLNAVLYNNVFIEIIRNGNGEVTDLNLLDIALIDIITKPNGDVIKYVQKNTGVEWTPENLWHFKYNDIGSNVWAEMDIRAIYDTLLIKDKIRQWIYWFFKTNQSKGLFTIKNGGDLAIKNFISYLKASDNDPSKPLILEGEAVYQLIRKFSEEGMSLHQMLEWCDAQVLSLLQMPPVAIGKMDVSGRSNSVEAYSSLATAVYGIQEELSCDITYELLPKIGFNKLIFSFGVLDYVNEEKVFKIIELMKNSGFTDEAITEWMNSQGLIFESEKVFNEPEVLMPNNDSSLSNTKSKGDLSKRYDPKSTRDNQLVKNSFDSRKYWTYITEES